MAGVSAPYSRLRRTALTAPALVALPRSGLVDDGSMHEPSGVVDLSEVPVEGHEGFLCKVLGHCRRADKQPGESSRLGELMLVEHDEVGASGPRRNAPLHRGCPFAQVIRMPRASFGSKKSRFVVPLAWERPRSRRQAQPRGPSGPGSSSMSRQSDPRTTEDRLDFQLKTSRRSAPSALRREPPPRSRYGGRRLTDHGRRDRTTHLYGRTAVLAGPAADQIDGSRVRPAYYRASRPGLIGRTHQLLWQASPARW